MKKVRNIDVFLVIWCTAMALWEVMNITVGLGNLGLHVIALAIQLGVGTLAVKSIIEDLQ